MVIDKNIKYGLKIGLLILDLDEKRYVICRENNDIWNCFIYDWEKYYEATQKDEDLEPEKELTFCSEDEVIEEIKKL